MITCRISSAILASIVTFRASLRRRRTFVSPARFLSPASFWLHSRGSASSSAVPSPSIPAQVSQHRDSGALPRDRQRHNMRLCGVSWRIRWDYLRILFGSQPLSRLSYGGMETNGARHVELNAGNDKVSLVPRFRSAVPAEPRKMFAFLRDVSSQNCARPSRVPGLLRQPPAIGCCGIVSLAQGFVLSVRSSSVTPHIETPQHRLTAIEAIRPRSI